MSPLLEASRILSPPDQSEVRRLCARILSETSLGVGVQHWTSLEDMTQMLANATATQGEEEARKSQHTLPTHASAAGRRRKGEAGSQRMEMFQNSLFTSPACGELNDQLSQFTREISGCTFTEPVKSAATGSPYYQVGPGARLGQDHVSIVSGGRSAWSGGWGPKPRASVTPTGGLWLTTARETIHSMGHQSFQVPRGTENLHKDLN